MIEGAEGVGAKGSGIVVFHQQQHADLAAHVDISLHHAAVGLIAGEAADGNLLADGNGRVAHQVGDGLAFVVHKLLVHQLVHVDGVGKRYMLGDVLAEVLEVVGIGHKVGFAVDLDDSAHGFVLGHIVDDSALGGDAAGLLGGGGEALLAQPLDGLFHFALSLNQSLFAVHHAGLRHFAQFLDHLRSDIRHYKPLLACDIVHGKGRACALPHRLTLRPWRLPLRERPRPGRPARPDGLRARRRPACRQSASRRGWRRRCRE